MPTWTDPGEVEFDAVLTAAGTASGLFVEVPLDTTDLFGTRGRVPVRVEVDDVAYHASLVAYGGPHLLAVLRAVRDRLGKGAGDRVHVSLRLAAEVSAIRR
ncbi:DUF1905 domain-containing protein [Cellulosimicrobium sp. PMB13]|uniref:DUF1905 domain-containing protein n=1 Tax=Cellulosimicrobium sp. PMB13 TaxID=3120158 RepID=UPI003F4AFBDE